MNKKLSMLTKKYSNRKNGINDQKEREMISVYDSLIAKFG